MKKVVWRWDWGVYMSFCPYCDEPAQHISKCVFCNKEYKWTEPKYKPTRVKAGDYTAVQTTSREVYILDKDGKWLYHAHHGKKLTEGELKGVLDWYLCFAKRCKEAFEKVEEEK